MGEAKRYPEIWAAREGGPVQFKRENGIVLKREKFPNGEQEVIVSIPGLVLAILVGQRKVISEEVIETEFGF